jgi:hypothetical protein
MPGQSPFANGDCPVRERGRGTLVAGPIQELNIDPACPHRVRVVDSDGNYKFEDTHAGKEGIHSPTHVQVSAPTSTPQTVGRVCNESWTLGSQATTSSVSTAKAASLLLTQSLAPWCIYSTCAVGWAGVLLALHKKEHVSACLQTSFRSAEGGSSSACRVTAPALSSVKSPASHASRKGLLGSWTSLATTSPPTGLGPCKDDVCIHANIHTYIHTYMHTCIHTCIHTHIHTYIHTYIHANIHTHTHTHIHTHIRTCIH